MLNENCALKTSMLPITLGLLELDNIILFPKTSLVLPLNNKLQQKLILDALANQHKMIGLMLPDAYAISGLHRIGTLAYICHHTVDGQNNPYIELQGIQKFAWVQEVPSITPYRQITYETLGHLDSYLPVTFMRQVTNYFMQYKQAYPKLYDILDYEFRNENYLQALTYIANFFPLSPENLQHLLESILLQDAYELLLDVIDA